MQDAVLLSQVLIGLGIFIWCVWVIIPLAVSNDTHQRIYSKHPNDKFGLKYFFGSFIIPLIVIMFGILVAYRVI